MAERACQGCGQTLSYKTSPPRWCAACLAKRNGDTRGCERCGAPVTTLYRRECDDCYVAPAPGPYDKRKAARHERGLKNRKVYVWEGELLHAAEIARRAGVKRQALYRRLKRTDDIHSAVEGAREVS